MTGRFHYFNSHPHEEDDAGVRPVVGVSSISTHILTKRMTRPLYVKLLMSSYFNSHPHEEDDLRLLLLWFRYDHFNSHPHEEDDPPVFLLLSCYKYFNSHPHEEDDPTVRGILPLCCISTHILTKRMTWEAVYGTFSNQEFQLTSSRRG